MIQIQVIKGNELFIQKYDVEDEYLIETDSKFVGDNREEFCASVDWFAVEEEVLMNYSNIPQKKSFGNYVAYYVVV